MRAVPRDGPAGARAVAGRVLSSDGLPPQVSHADVLGGPARSRGRRRAGRPAVYGSELRPILERAGHASDQLSGKLLQPVLPALLTALRQHHGVEIAAPVRTRLLAASPATLDRLRRPVRQRRARQPRRSRVVGGATRARASADVPARAKRSRCAPTAICGAAWPSRSMRSSSVRRRSGDRAWGPDSWLSAPKHDLPDCDE